MTSLTVIVGNGWPNTEYDQQCSDPLISAFISESAFLGSIIHKNNTNNSDPTSLIGAIIVSNLSDNPLCNNCNYVLLSVHSLKASEINTTLHFELYTLLLITFPKVMK